MVFGFRAKRTVKDPYGKVWELYTTRTTMPRDPNAPGLYDRNTKIMDDPLEFGIVLGIPLAIAQYIGSTLLAPLLRLPFRYAKGKRSGAIRIEAISFFPGRETRYWTTTPDQLESILNEIAVGLAAGQVPQPTGAVYMGSREE